MQAEATRNTTELDLKQLESDCASYLQEKAAEKYAKERADAYKALILNAVQKHGAVPAGAEKSRRLETAGFIATVTTGTSVEINDEKCTELALLLSKARCSRLFPALFERRSEYSLAKTAAATIKTAAWPKRFREEITSLYASCFTPKTKTPSLDVESRAEAAERELKAAEKASKKRAGKAAA